MKIFLSLLLLFPAIIFAQDKVGEHKVLNLKEGIYLKFLQFKNNSPLDKHQVVTDLNKNELNFYSEITSRQILSYVDDSGSVQKINPKSAWGYSRNNQVYINVENQFYRIPVLGSISHFIATVTVFSTPYFDPVYLNTMPATTRDDLRQFMLDFETGKILDYNMKNFESLLSRDEQLFLEFSALKKREKKNKMFIFIRKFNERHPLVFD